MKYIPLTQGYIALVDDEDFERINKNKWFAQVTKTGQYTVHVHAARWSKGIYPRYMIRMHHEILDIDVKKLNNEMKLVDHENRNGIDNQKYNLRISDKSKNSINSARSDQAVGIYYEKSRDRYKAFLLNPRRYIGTYKTYQEAKSARDALI